MQVTYSFLHRHLRDRATASPDELTLSPLAVEVVSESGGSVKESTLMLEEGRKNGGRG